MKQIRLGKTTLFQSSKTFSALIAALALLAGAMHGYAATNLTWIGSNGDFNTAANWDTGTIPTDGDQTFFTNSVPIAVNIAANSPTDGGGGGSSEFTGQVAGVTFNIGASATWSITNDFRVGNGPNTDAVVVTSISTATVYIAGGTLSVANGDGTAQIRIGDGTNVFGQLFITNGTVVADRTSAGASFASAGQLVIVGPGIMTNSQNNGTLNIGSTTGNSVGSSLVMSNGAKLFVAGETRIGATGASNNFALITGPGTIWSNFVKGVRVGAGGGQGNILIVSNGAKVYMNNAGTIGGNGSNSFNHAIITGAGSVYETDADDTHTRPSKIAVGTNAGPFTNNTLSVYDGARLICGGSLTIGDASSGVCYSNGVYMGGPGLLSTGSAENVRLPSGSVWGFFIFTNCYFTTAQMSLNAGWTNTIAINSNATVILSNSVNLFPDTAPATNNVNLGGATVQIEPPHIS